MNWPIKNKRTAAFAIVFSIAVIGTYNAVVINGHSSIESDVQFAKRVDEVYGIVTPGRSVAAATTWKKLPHPKKIVIEKAPTVAVSDTVKTTTDTIAPPAFDQDLDLNLVEVVNAKRWAKGIPEGQFSGGLKAHDGVIENLSLSLPDGESLGVSFAELSGNVFEYDLNGESMSGLIYQVDQQTYMVSFTNGPLEGTRMKFSQNSAPEQSPEPTPETQEMAANQLDFQSVSFQF